MIQSSLLQFFGILLCGLGGVLLNIMPRPIARLGGLIMLYIGGSVLLLNVCSFQMCAALFVCGIGAVVLIGSALRENTEAASPRGTTREWFLLRLFLAAILGLLAYTSNELLRFWIPVRQTILFIGLWIGLMGLASLTLDDMMLSRCICLQSICLAFTICYVYLENSVLVFASFAAINLLLAFCGSVLSMNSTPEAHRETGS